MEKLKFNEKKFPNVISSYGELAWVVVNEMTRYVKGPVDEEIINSILDNLESDLALERESYSCKKSQPVPVQVPVQSVV